MAREDLILTLAKVLVAAAWADGELSHEEINSMKDLLYGLPQLTARQWASLQIYLEAPVEDAERARLVSDLQYAIRTPTDRSLALAMLDQMMHADGRFTDEEEQVAAEIRMAIESVDVSVLARLVKGMVGRRSQAVADAPNREDHLEDYVRNKVYYGLRRRIDKGEAALELDDNLLRTLSLAGGVMAQVARINPEVTQAEIDTMIEALQTHWNLSAERATFVVEVAVSEMASVMDRYRLARQFAEACSRDERLTFLDVLFAIAAANGMATYGEIEELRTLARALKLSHEEFIEAKLKIPREKREQ
jgi:uncharacterized tellurite resistance protein B-like protein